MKKNHFYRVVLSALFCLFATLFASAQTSQPVIAYLSIEGAKTGIFKGNAVTEGNEGKIECIGFRYGVTIPHDVESGRSSGKRQHSPIVIIKSIDYSSPQLLQSAYSNEVLKNVTIEFLKKDREGRTSSYYRITLTNATISQISQYGGIASADNTINLNNNGGMYEEVSLTFQSIEFDHLIGNTSAVDNWNR
jgi:type VI secretion system secreted protein Hcp